MKPVLFFCLILLAVAVGPIAAAGNVLFDHGGADAVIVLDPEATPPAKYAAKELQAYLEKVSGVRLDIVAEPGPGVNLFVGEGAGTRAAGLNTDGLSYDGFRIKSSGNNIYLFGRDRKEAAPLVDFRSPMQDIHVYNKKLDICAFGESGTLYAVYEFLRSQCGIRWYMPGDLGEVVPHADRLEVGDLDYEKSPDFYYRMLFMGLFDQNDEGALWYRRAGFGAPFPVNINHSFVNFRKYKDSHPEWFALIDGKRDFDISCQGDGNLCLSAPGLLEAVVADANAYFDAHPEQYVYCVMPNDWFNRICDCAACQAQAEYDKPEYGKFSKYVWSFVNRVAKEVAKTHPDKFIGCCAYNTYAMVPEGMEFEPNVAVMFTKALSFRFDDFYRERNDVRCYKWAHTVKTLFCWEYYCWDLTNGQLTGLPIFFPHWIDTDIRKLKGISNGFFVEVENGYTFSNPGINHPNLYILGRKLWDADADVDALLEDYYTNFYGPAKDEMKQFWTLAETLWCDMSVKDRGPDADLTKTLYTPEKLEQLRGFCEAALAKCPPDSVYAKRVKLIQQHFYSYVDKVNNTRSQLPAYTIRKAPGAVTIDGVREDLWRSADVADMVRTDSARPADAATFARCFHDDRNLYIFIDADEPDPNAMVTAAKGDDSDLRPYIWDDDSFEIFIAPSEQAPESYAHLIVNSAGNLYDLWHNSEAFPAPQEKAWNSGTVVRTAKRDGGWCVELAVPLASLTVDGRAPDKTWRINFARNRNVNEIETQTVERSSWSPTLCDSLLRPGRFGTAVLE